jgi:hypothetical protein
MRNKKKLTSEQWHVKAANLVIKHNGCGNTSLICENCFTTQDECKRNKGLPYKDWEKFVVYLAKLYLYCNSKVV